jgi:hypothetical protein
MKIVRKAAVLEAWPFFSEFYRKAPQEFRDQVCTVAHEGCNWPQIHQREGAVLQLMVNDWIYRDEAGDFSRMSQVEFEAGFDGWFERATFIDCIQREQMTIRELTAALRTAMKMIEAYSVGVSAGLTVPATETATGDVVEMSTELMTAAMEQIRTALLRERGLICA